MKPLAHLGHSEMTVELGHRLKPSNFKSGFPSSVHTIFISIRFPEHLQKAWRSHKQSTRKGQRIIIMLLAAGRRILVLLDTGLVRLYAEDQQAWS